MMEKQVRADLEHVLGDFVGCMYTEETMARLKRRMRAVLFDIEKRNGLDNYFVLEVDAGSNSGHPRVMAGRNYARYPMTPREFDSLRESLPAIPTHTLERINCIDVGNPGHQRCGWCLKHDVPRTECGCRWIVESRA